MAAYPSSSSASSSTLPSLPSIASTSTLSVASSSSSTTPATTTMTTNTRSSPDRGLRIWIEEDDIHSHATGTHPHPLPIRASTSVTSTQYNDCYKATPLRSAPIPHSSPVDEASPIRTPIRRLPAIPAQQPLLPQPQIFGQPQRRAIRPLPTPPVNARPPSPSPSPSPQTPEAESDDESTCSSQKTPRPTVLPRVEDSDSDESICDNDNDDGARSPGTKPTLDWNLNLDFKLDLGFDLGFVDDDDEGPLFPVPSPPHPSPEVCANVALPVVEIASITTTTTTNADRPTSTTLSYSDRVAGPGLEAVVLVPNEPQQPHLHATRASCAPRRALPKCPVLQVGPLAIAPRRPESANGTVSAGSSAVCTPVIMTPNEEMPRLEDTPKATGNGDGVFLVDDEDEDEDPVDFAADVHRRLFFASTRREPYQPRPLGGLYASSECTTDEESLPATPCEVEEEAVDYTWVLSNRRLHQSYSSKWVREKNGKRRTAVDFTEIMAALRTL